MYHIMIARCLEGKNIECFCEWDFCHWAVFNVDGYHKAVIVVLDLLDVHLRNISFEIQAVPDACLGKE